MIEYIGLGNSREVFVQGVPLDPLFDEVNHSPDGFNWGYGGSGPHQLSYAILRHYYGDADFVKKHYRVFTHEVIANLPMDNDFVLTGDQIDDWSFRLRRNQ